VIIFAFIFINNTEMPTMPQLFRGNGRDEPFWIPSTSSTLLTMLGFSLVHLILAWYFMQVTSRSEQFSRPFYFPFDPRYWGFISSRQAIVSVW
jgi:F0F1-type ATP synthase membrane subunit a